MNRNWRKLVLLPLIVAAVAIAACSEKDNDKTENPIATITQKINGRVVDASKSPLQGVSVSAVIGGSTRQATTNASGVYEFTNATEGLYQINATKSGYTYGQTTATVTEDGAIVSDITISALAAVEERVEETATAQEIATSGISITTDKSATVDNVVVEREVSASIPVGTVMQVGGQDVVGSVSLSVTPVSIADVPPAPQNELQMGNVVFEPANATFDKPVEVKMPLEIKLPAGLQIPIKKYDNGVWREVGSATIDESGLGATGEVQEFGTLAVQPEVTITTQSGNPVETPGEPQDVPENQQYVEVTVTNTVTFPGGLPAGVSAEYALALIERINGIKTNESITLKMTLPTASKVAVGKPASPLSPESPEYWVQTCEYTTVSLLVPKVVNLEINIGDIFYNYEIQYEYQTFVIDVNCTQTWREHNQGGSN